MIIQNKARQSSSARRGLYHPLRGILSPLWDIIPLVGKQRKTGYLIVSESTMERIKITENAPNTICIVLTRFFSWASFDFSILSTLLFFDFLPAIIFSLIQMFVKSGRHRFFKFVDGDGLHHVRIRSQFERPIHHRICRL